MTEEKHVPVFNGRGSNFATSLGGYGQKARNLALLSAFGVAVPEWEIISADVFDRTLSRNGTSRDILLLLDRLTATNISAVSAEATRIIEGLDVQGEVSELVSVACSNLQSESLAVRSSSEEEDSEGASFAGLFESFINVRSVPQAVTAVKACWASAFSEGALGYGRRINGAGYIPHMAVIIQRMINGDKSGVIFTADPITGDDGCIVICAVPGLGTGFVSGLVEADTYFIDRINGATTEVPSPSRSTRAVVDADHGGWRLVRAGGLKRSQGILTPDEIGRISALALEVEKEFGSPQDIEWTLGAERLWILQTRPITSAGPSDRPEDLKRSTTVGATQRPRPDSAEFATSFADARKVPAEDRAPIEAVLRWLRQVGGAADVGALIGPAAFYRSLDEAGVGHRVRDLVLLQKADPFRTARYLAELRQIVRNLDLSDAIAGDLLNQCEIAAGSLTIHAVILDPNGRPVHLDRQDVWADGSGCPSLMDAIRQCWSTQFTGEALAANHGWISTGMVIVLVPGLDKVPDPVTDTSVGAVKPGEARGLFGMISRQFRVFHSGICAPLFARALQKKVWLRRLAVELGIAIWQGWYVVYDEAALPSQLDDLLAVIRTKWVLVDWGPSVGRAMVLLSDLKGSLAERCPQGHGHTCALISEMLHPASSEGCSAITDGKVIVEAYPSGTNHKTGNLEPSIYILSAAGVVLDAIPAQFRVHATLESGTFAGEHGWVETPCPSYSLEIDDSENRQIAWATIALSETAGEVRAEWTAWQGTIFLQDASFEQEPLELEGRSRVVTATGEAVGRVFRVVNTDLLEAFVSSQSIGILSYDDREDFVDDGELVQRLKKLAALEPVILVAKYPSVGLLPLLPYCVGLIVEQGTLLCHTAIVLRELKLPGVVVASALNRFRGG